MNIHRGFYTADMGVGSSALCENREARTRTGKGYRSHLVSETELTITPISREAYCYSIEQVLPPEALKRAW